MGPMPEYSAALSAGFAEEERALLLDEVLFVRYQETREKGDLAVLIERYQSDIMRIATAILRNSDDAENAAQETWLKVLKTASMFDPEKGSFDSWLQVIIRRTAFDILRSRKAHAAMSLDDERTDEAPVKETASPIEQEEDRAVITAALDRLEEHYRAAILAMHVDGQSGKQAGEQMKKSPDVVRQNVRRGIVRLSKDEVLRRQLAIGA
jgi:RNA polymerase sigma-70 factor, ECF subfamily